MRGTSIGLIAALPEEWRPLERWLGKPAVTTIKGLPLCRWVTASGEVALIQSGVGANHAATATATLLDTVSPRLLLSFGFAGAAADTLAVGDLVVAQQLMKLEGGKLTALTGLDEELGVRLIRILDSIDRAIPRRVKGGSFITVPATLPKAEMVPLLSPNQAAPVLEMETAACAAVAADYGVALAAIRAISDGIEEELHFTVEELLDARGSVRPARLIRVLSRRPLVLQQLFRLARNVRVAGENLAWALHSLFPQL